MHNLFSVKMKIEAAWVQVPRKIFEVRHQCIHVFMFFKNNLTNVHLEEKYDVVVFCGKG